MNSVNLIGRLVRDPNLRYIPNSGTAISDFTLAIDKNLSKDKKAEMEGKNQPTADFVKIVAWGKMGENCANFLSKGRLVGVQGRLQSGSYDDKDGKKVYTTDVVASNVEFLEFGDKKQTDNAMPDIDGFQPTSNDDLPF